MVTVEIASEAAARPKAKGKEKEKDKDGVGMCNVFSHSEAGGHPTNEDAFEVRQHPEGRSCWLCALADGQGGRAGGGEAARLACRITIEVLSALPESSALKAAMWVGALRTADERVQADRDAGYTTLIGFAVSGGRIVGASNGDSAVWLVDGAGRIVDLTDRQAKNPPVGSGGARPTPFEADLPASWLVLAMSDGVWKYVGGDRLRELLRGSRGRELLDTLREQARLPRGGGLSDDFTAVLLQGPPASSGGTRP
jgi:PPM family protein phosphatase